MASPTDVLAAIDEALARITDPDIRSSLEDLRVELETGTRTADSAATSL